MLPKGKTTMIWIKSKVNHKHAGGIWIELNCMRACLPRAFDYLKTVVNCGVKWDLIWAKQFTYKFDHTALATLASKDNLEIAQINGDRTSYHKSTKPYLVKDLEITQLDKARGKIDRLGDRIGELTPFNLPSTFYLPLRGPRTSSSLQEIAKAPPWPMPQSYSLQEIVAQVHNTRLMISKRITHKHWDIENFDLSRISVTSQMLTMVFSPNQTLNQWKTWDIAK